jgi:hypothetical protein
MALETAAVAPANYSHLELGKDIAAGIAGYYTPYKEVRLPFRGREVLYVVGRAVLEASCCGTGNWVYATVPGYVLGWYASKKDGLHVSEVEPIKDDGDRQTVAKIIENAESVEVVTFW